MFIPPSAIEGRKFCVVFVKVIDEVKERVQLQCIRGRASYDRGKLSVISEDGCSFTVPGTAVNNILPSDGTPLLKDAEYFCFVKLDPSIQLAGNSQDDFIIHDCDCDDDCDCGCEGEHHHHHH